MSSPNVEVKGLERKHEVLIKSIDEDTEELEESKNVEGSPTSIERFSQYHKSEEGKFEEVLTDPQTKSIWRSYFRHDGNVNVELFVNCLMNEYKNIFPNNPDLLYKALNIIKERISLDGVNVSLDALQIFTRLNGMESTLKEIVTAILEEHNKEEQESHEVQEEIDSNKEKLTNEQLLEEIEGVKNMLDDKHKALIKKEQALREKELLLQNQQSDFMQKITDFACSEIKRNELILNKLVNAKMRRLESLEQLIESKLATLRRKMPENKLKQSVSFVQSEGNVEEKLKKQKTRIASLEQMYKELKAKYNDALDKLEKEKVKSTEYARQYEKYKGITKIQEQKIQRQEQTPQNIVDTPKTNSQKENELEVQKPRPKIIPECPKEPLKAYITLTSDIIKATKAYLLSKNLGIGELFYSSMGSIIPEVVDCIHLSQGIQMQDAFLSILEVVWESANFAFEHYITKPGKKSPVKKIEYKFGPLKKLYDNTKKECEALPIYPLFTNQGITKVLLKDIESLFETKKTSKVKDKLSIVPKVNQVRAEVLVSLLILVLTDSEKKIKEALERLKVSLNDKASDTASKELCHYKGIPIIAIGSTLDPIRQDCIEILLALSIDPIAKKELFKQLNNKEAVVCLVNAFESSVDVGNNDQQDDIVVLMHKLIVANEITLDSNTIESLRKVLQKALKSIKGNERRFFLSNVESLNTHLNSLKNTT